MSVTPHDYNTPHVDYLLRFEAYTRQHCGTVLVHGIQPIFNLVYSVPQVTMIIASVR